MKQANSDECHAAKLHQLMGGFTYISQMLDQRRSIWPSIESFQFDASISLWSYPYVKLVVG